MFGERPTFYRKTLGVVAILVAIATATSVWLQIANLTFAGLFDRSHYFSYFTIATTILTVIILLYGGLSSLNSERESTWNTVIHLAVIASSVVAGVMFHLIIARSDSAQTMPIDYDSFPMAMFHTYLPIYLVAEWIINPYRAKIPWFSLAVVTIFPAAWFGFTLFRGYETSWYPYQFLNPQSEAGWAGVATHVASATVVLLGISLFLLLTNRLSHRLKSRSKTLTLTR
jgi:hypothetical protein